MRRFRMSVVGVLAFVAILMAFPFQALAGNPEYLIPLDHPFAAFLESRAVAAKMGASAEFRKMEGVAVDPVNNKLYIAMTEINKSMADQEGDIQLPQNNCGIVYVADLDQNYNINALVPAVVGGPENTEDKANPCHVDAIANPDGLYVDGKGNLWIAEDSEKGHKNNVLWMWDGKTLQRFATVPVGAEVTGLHITADGTIFFNVQHPSAMNSYPYNRGVVGVVNGYKAGEPFTPLPVPTGDDMHVVKVAAGEYQVLARVGELIPQDVRGHRFGQVYRPDGSLQLVCNNPDGNMFLPVNASGSEGYLYTNYECQAGAVVKLYLRRTGNAWEVVEGENVEFKSVHGTWNNCNASVTPWNTGLTSEEYEPVALKDGWKENVAPMSDYLGRQANPYDYGWSVELMPDKTGASAQTLVAKRYAMGRRSWEMGKVMPDGKTVYMGDDGSNVVLFKFVADNAGDLSAGSLFAAKVTQQPDQSLALEWILLGSANEADIYDAIRSIELPM